MFCGNQRDNVGDKEKCMEVQGYNEPIPMAIKSEKISGQKNITHSRHN